MTETVIVGLISGVFVAVAAYIGQRHAPSRRVIDTASIVDSGGKVISTLRAEIDRLDTEVTDARAELIVLKADLKTRPTRDELLDANGKLRRQLVDLGETPINGPVAP